MNARQRSIDARGPAGAGKWLSEGERSGGEAEVVEDGLGRGGAKHDGHDAPGASATRGTEDVGGERPLQELGPGDGPRGGQDPMPIETPALGAPGGRQP
jgi:hypothetical protein